MTTTYRGVKLVHWNPPAQSSSQPYRRLPWAKKMNNFGDLLGPRIVRQLASVAAVSRAPQSRRLLSVGSVIRLARDGDVVWGSGANGKSLDRPLPFSEVDVRAVRGPLTRAYLLDRGIDVPEVFGDPALLLGRMWPRELFRGGPRSSKITIVPNLHDLSQFSPDDDRVVDPRWSLKEVLRRIAGSDYVVGSSLHAIVVADAWGVPARLIRSRTEPEFKYLDYFLGSGRSEAPLIANDLDDAMRLGPAEAPRWDSGPLLAAFPLDVWNGREDR